MGLAPKILRVVFGAVQEMNAQGKTVLLVEQNARAGLRMAGLRRRAGERPGAADRHRRRGARAPGDRRALPRRSAGTPARAAGVILDCHCHIIPAGMLAGGCRTTGALPLGVQDGRQVVSFQGRRLSSVTGEFCDVRRDARAGRGRRGDQPAALPVDPAAAGAGGPGDRGQDLPDAEREPGRDRRAVPAAGYSRSARCRCRTAAARQLSLST